MRIVHGNHGLPVLDSLSSTHGTRNETLRSGSTKRSKGFFDII